jgi:probable phosphoglycerate mutase
VSSEIGLPKLLFVRHGETDWNRAGRMQGQLDIPLNDRGRLQAARNGRVLARLAEGGDWAAAVSPLSRARETFEIMRETGVTASGPNAEDSLKEIAFGAFEGLTPRQIREQHAELMPARKADTWNFAPPGGESYADLSARVWTWLETLNAPTVVVAHGGVMRVILRRLAGIPESRGTRIFTPQHRVLAINGETLAFF